jgi:hypothetical protein
VGKGEETLRSVEWNHAGLRLRSQRYIFRGGDEKKGIRPLTSPVDTSSVTPPEIPRKKERGGKEKRIPLVISEAIFRRGIWPYRDNVLASWDFIWTCCIAVARESRVIPIALTRQIKFVLKTALRRKMCLRIRASLPREGGQHVERIPSTSTISHGPNYMECCRLSSRRNSRNSLREIADSPKLPGDSRFFLALVTLRLLLYQSSSMIRDQDIIWYTVCSLETSLLISRELTLDTDRSCVDLSLTSSWF